MEQKDHLLSFQIIAKIKIRVNPWSIQDNPRFYRDNLL